MPTDTISIIGSVGGVAINAAVSRTGTGGMNVEATLPAAKAGSLTTRTDDNTGTITATAHGITNGQKVNVFWAGGCRYGMDAGSVATDTLVVDGGAGDNLPAQSTAVTVSVQVELDLADFAGDALKMFVVTCDQRTHVQFQEAASVEAAKKDMPASEPWLWASDSGVTNPLAGKSVIKAVTSCGGTAAGTLKIGMRYNT